jgi:hypothetical protein
VTVGEPRRFHGLEVLAEFAEQALVVDCPAELSKDLAVDLGLIGLDHAFPSLDIDRPELIDAGRIRVWTDPSS